MQRVLSVPVVAALAAFFSLSFLVACGGGSSTNTTVTQIVLSPSSISLNEGGVATLSAVAENSAGSPVAADITFTSSNTSVATISTGGLICGGQWDSSIINCNPTNGAAGVGQVTITATATATPSVQATITVYVHETVDAVQAVLGTSCTSMTQTVSISGKAFTTTAPGCSVANPCDITSTVGPFAFGSNDTSIVSINATTGNLVGQTPGATTVFASVSGVNSVGTPYLTCPVARIMVHSASNSDTSFTLGGAATQALTADVYDTNNFYIKPTLTWGSSSNAVATVSASGTVNNPGTITGVAAGTAYITATCSYPDCNKYIPAQYSQNVVTATVTGSSSTTVYAASSNSKMLVPFNITTDNPGTPIALPNYPNSIVADPSGAGVYLGSSGGLMTVSASSGTLTTLGVGGTIVSISADGKYMLLSDSVAGTLNYFSTATATITSTLVGVNLSSSAFTPDSKYNLWVMATQLGFGLQTGSPSQITLPFTADTLDLIAEGALAYITSPTAHEVDIYSTCNHSEVQPLAANAPTLVKAIPNGTGAVAADSPALDVISTPNPLSSGCPTTTQSSIATFDLGVGSFTAQQLVMSPDSSRAWLISDLPQVVSFNLSTLTPTAITLNGSATPFNGGMTMDSEHLYVGASDNTVHRIDTATMSDVAQIPVGLKDANGNVTPPNLLCVLP